MAISVLREKRLRESGGAARTALAWKPIRRKPRAWGLGKHAKRAKGLDGFAEASKAFRKAQPRDPMRAAEPAGNAAKPEPAAAEPGILNIPYFYFTVSHLKKYWGKSLER
nr:hypothetical protein [Bacillaceae bacterium]